MAMKSMLIVFWPFRFLVFLKTCMKQSRISTVWESWHIMFVMFRFCDRMREQQGRFWRLQVMILCQEMLLLFQITAWCHVMWCFLPGRASSMRACSLGNQFQSWRAASCLAMSNMTQEIMMRPRSTHYTAEPKSSKPGNKEVSTATA